MPTASATVTALDPVLTNLSAVRYSVKFGVAVTGVGVEDFDIVTSGPSAASISGSGTDYVVTVNVAGSDTVNLSIADDADIRNGSNNLLHQFTPLQPVTYSLPVGTYTAGELNGDDATDLVNLSGNSHVLSVVVNQGTH